MAHLMPSFHWYINQLHRREGGRERERERAAFNARGCETLGCLDIFLTCCFKIQACPLCIIFNPRVQHAMTIAGNGEL